MPNILNDIYFIIHFAGYAPIHLAVQKSNVDMLRILVRGQADVDMPDGKSGRTPLHHAVELDDLPVAGFLLLEVSISRFSCCQIQEQLFIFSYFSGRYAVPK